MYEVPPPHTVDGVTEHGKVVEPAYVVVVIVVVASRHVMDLDVGHVEIVTIGGCCDDTAHPCIQELG